jgi:hypothetical protein
VQLEKKSKKSCRNSSLGSFKDSIANLFWTRKRKICNWRRNRIASLLSNWINRIKISVDSGKVLLIAPVSFLSSSIMQTIAQKRQESGDEYQFLLTNFIFIHSLPCHSKLS